MRLDPTFDGWRAAEETAEQLVPLLGRLYRDHGVVVMVNGVSLVQRGPTDLVVAHRRGHTLHGHDLRLKETKAALEVLVGMDLAPAEIDVGKLLVEFHASGATSLEGWVAERCAGLPRASSLPERTAVDVVLYGFGRIGRILARLLVAKAGNGNKYRLRAIVVRKQAEDDLERRANLLRRDSVHGAFDGDVRLLPEENALLINGSKVLLLHADGPEQVDYTAYGLSDVLIIDNTGKWRDRAGLSRHLQSKGAGKVILTAPGKGDLPNIVAGINHTSVGPDERLLTAASCTTNAIVPVLKSMNDGFGILSGHIETVHAFTNDQNLIDNYHKKERRGRSAALNLVITETGAASAVAKALPELKGKLTGSAIRVPTPNVSLAILHLALERPASKEEINQHLREAATASELAPQIGWTAMQDTVSTDMVGDTHAGVVDSLATIATPHGVVLYVWYDNEYGYSCQVMRMLEHVAGIKRPRFP
jgi:glyceraldehyde 3-phosphate dehydrogenase